MVAAPGTPGTRSHPGPGTMQIDATRQSIDGSFTIGEETVIFDAKYKVDANGGIAVDKVRIYDVDKFDLQSAQNKYRTRAMLQLRSALEEAVSEAGFESGTLTYYRDPPKDVNGKPTVEKGDLVTHDLRIKKK